MATFAQSAQGEPLFTCLSCAIAFLTAEDQRAHYRSDHHRYNMKRRVANLPPVSAAIFNQKVLERRAETAVTTSLKGSTCEICNKVYLSENAYRSHMNSKKHRENELQAAIALSLKREEPPTEVPSYQAPDVDMDSAKEDTTQQKPAEAAEAPAEAHPEASMLRADAEDDVTMEEQTIDQKIASSRTRLTPLSCLFCSNVASTIPLNLSHMSTAHGFFIPDAEFLEDVQGLLTYLGEKIAIGNVCLYCNGKGRQMHSLEAVRKHMIDKSHCKLAYDTEDDRLEIAEWYNFEKSYPRKQKKAGKKVTVEEEEEEEWEDVDDDGEADEVIEEDGSDEEPSEEDDDDDIPGNQITYGDTHYELVLPSGARIGHRSLKRYYDQSFSFRGAPRTADPNSGAAIVRRLIGDKQSALVPRKGGFGAFGTGTEVVKARNRGEAREAGRHVREFRDVQRRQQFKTLVGYRGNAQKHFRDPLLQ